MGTASASLCAGTLLTNLSFEALHEQDLSAGCYSPQRYPNYTAHHLAGRADQGVRETAQCLQAYGVIVPSEP